MTKAAPEQRFEQGSFFPVSPLLLFPASKPTFRVYLRQDERFVLYTREQQRFDLALRQKLHDMGVESVWVMAGQRLAYERYVEEHLGAILGNGEIPVGERARVFYDASTTLMREVCGLRLPMIAAPLHTRLERFVRGTVEFLAGEEAFRHLARLISHTYTTFSHSLHVYVYLCVLLASLRVPEDELVRHGMGALLHDMGKTRIPKRILDKPGKLDEDEWDTMRRHPLFGVAVCAGVSLPQEAMNAILFHHERMDGTGYPAGLAGEAIPWAVRCLTLCDVYDALTSERSYAEAMAPYDALKLMRDQMRPALDMELYKRLVLILSGADLLG